jgi:RNase adaptor protein for sRNA GlmZ degradation
MDSTPQLFQYDIRALPNPPKNIRTQYTGMHKPLREWFFARPEVVAKFDEVVAEVDAAIAQCSVYPAEVHVNVCCEMGKHRSVAFVEELGRWPFFIAQERCQMEVKHRDIARAKHDPRSRRQRPDRTEG